MDRKERFLVEDSDISLASLTGRKPEIELRDVEILVLPSSEEKNVFYLGTLEILDYLHENSDSTKVQIFSTDDEYRELVRHSADFWIGCFLVSSVVVVAPHLTVEEEMGHLSHRSISCFCCFVRLPRRLGGCQRGNGTW